MKRMLSLITVMASAGQAQAHIATEQSGFAHLLEHGSVALLALPVLMWLLLARRHQN